MPAPARVLWVALDAVDPEIARQLAAEGDMPNLARELSRLTSLRTEGSVGVFPSALWPTIYTARDPGTHGYHCWDVHTGGGYEYRETTPAEVDGTPFWYHLSDAGHRVAVFDVPHTRADHPLHGIQLSEWGCHDRHYGTTSYPRELAGAITEAFGPHPLGTAPSPWPDRGQFAPCDYLHREGPHRRPDEFEALWSDLLTGMERKRAASLALLDRGEWDLFMTVLGEGHCFGHQMWHLHDTSHPLHDPVLAARVGGDPLREAYRRLDDVLGDHLARADDDTVVVVQLSHGMAAHHDGSHLLAPVLERLEQQADGRLDRGWQGRAGRALGRLPEQARRALLSSAAPQVRRRIDGFPGAPLHDPVYDLKAGPDRLWWYAPNNSVVGGVRLNLAGREPAGRIQPDEYQPALQWLRSRLLDLVNVDTGRPCVLRVLFTDDEYDRSATDSFPDHFVEWDRAAPIERIWSPLTGVVIRQYDHWRTGDHRPEGLVLVRVPGVPRSPALGGIRHIDLAPTVCATIGVTLPDIDGLPRPDLLGTLAPRGTPRRGPDLPRDPKPARPWTRPSPATRAGLAALGRGVTALRLRVDRREQEDAQAIDAVHARIEREVDAIDSRFGALTAENVELAEQLARAERLATIPSTMAWIRNSPLEAEPLISVITATYQRDDRIGAAIDSVIAQSYTNWEMVIVDDGGTDGTAEVVASFADPRLQYVRVEHRGCTAARNDGLRRARGELVAYLDDDNRFDPDWLRSVAWAFAEHPDVIVAYGARVIDDPGRLVGDEPGEMPWVHFEAWDRETCEGYNLVDMNVLAHRADSGVEFDADVAVLGDWDLLLKLTEKRDPVPLPVIAAYYTTTAPDRLTSLMAGPEHDREYHHVRQNVAHRRAASDTSDVADGT